jgi:hypothetical protein
LSILLNFNFSNQKDDLKNNLIWKTTGGTDRLGAEKGKNFKLENFFSPSFV